MRAARWILAVVSVTLWAQLLAVARPARTIALDQPTPIATSTAAPGDIVLTGTVYDALRGPVHRIVGATVSVCMSVPRCFPAQAGPGGRYTLLIPALYAESVQLLQASALGYYPLTQLVTAQELRAQPQRDLALIPWQYHACLPVILRSAELELLPVPTGTARWTATVTPTRTALPTLTETPRLTSTPSQTASPTPIPTATEAPDPTWTETPGLTATPTETPAPTETAAQTETPLATATLTLTSTATETPTHTPTLTATPTETVTATPTESPTATATPSPTVTLSCTPTNTDTPTATATGTALPTLSPTATHTATPAGTAMPTPTATLAAGSILVTAWVSDSAPAQYTTVTVYGKITLGLVGIANVPMHTIWQYKTTKPTCDGVSGTDGVASCGRYIGSATKGYRVDITVQFTYDGQQYSAITGFTPQ